MIIVFDGICNLCNGLVDFVVRRDPGAAFQFASLQSQAGAALLRQRALDSERLQTIVLIDGERTYIKSDAALRILRALPGWGWVSICFIIPTVIRNAVYDLIARSRYRLLGKRDTCRVPTPEERSRFL